MINKINASSLGGVFSSVGSSFVNMVALMGATISSREVATLQNDVMSIVRNKYEQDADSGLPPWQDVEAVIRQQVTKTVADIHQDFSNGASIISVSARFMNKLNEEVSNTGSVKLSSPDNLSDILALIQIGDAKPLMRIWNALRSAVGSSGPARLAVGTEIKFYLEVLDGHRVPTKAEVALHSNLLVSSILEFYS